MNERRSEFGWLERAAIAASVVLLIGAGLESRHFRPPPDATQYLNRVRDAVNAIPITLGSWHGVDGSVEIEAIKLLHPNAMISRDYSKPSVGGGLPEHIGFMFLACSDARDTVGHYPPICYPSQGWSLELKETKNWPLGEPVGGASGGRRQMVIHGTEYTFVRSLFEARGSEIVDNFFVLPNTGVVADRDEVINAAGDLQRRFYGVAQVQIIFSSETNSEERDRDIEELMTPLEGVIHTIQDINTTRVVKPGGTP